MSVLLNIWWLSNVIGTTAAILPDFLKSYYGKLYLGNERKQLAYLFIKTELLAI